MGSAKMYFVIHSWLSNTSLYMTYKPKYLHYILLYPRGYEFKMFYRQTRDNEKITFFPFCCSRKMFYRRHHCMRASLILYFHEFNRESNNYSTYYSIYVSPTQHVVRVVWKIIIETGQSTIIIIHYFFLLKLNHHSLYIRFQ